MGTIDSSGINPVAGPPGVSRRITDSHAGMRAPPWPGAGDAGVRQWTAHSSRQQARLRACGQGQDVVDQTRPDVRQLGGFEVGAHRIDLVAIPAVDGLRPGLGQVQVHAAANLVELSLCLPRRGGIRARCDPRFQQAEQPIVFHALAPVFPRRRRYRPVVAR